MMEAACYSESVYIRLDSGVFQKALIPTGTAVRTSKRNFRLAASKQAAQRFDGERFNIRKLNELEVRKQYQIEITNRYLN
jgi:hypothetical protein